MTIMEEQRYYLGLQVAELDTAYSDYSGRLIHTEFGLGETARDLEFLQDYASSIHYGLVEIGGFRRYNELTTDQNRHMYATERANLTSFHVMGGDRYMRLVAQHSTGIHAATDNTDPQALGQEQQEQGEESDMEVDPAVDTPDVDSREHVVNRLRVLIHECLSRHEYSDAAAVQQLVLMTLDRGVPGVALSAVQFHRLLMDMVEGLDTRFRRSNNHSRSHTGEIFRRCVEEFEVQLGIRSMP